MRRVRRDLVGLWPGVPQDQLERHCRQCLLLRGFITRGELMSGCAGRGTNKGRGGTCIQFLSAPSNPSRGRNGQFKREDFNLIYYPCSSIQESLWLIMCSYAFVRTPQIYKAIPLRVVWAYHSPSSSLSSALLVIIVILRSGSNGEGGRRPGW